MHLMRGDNGSAAYRKRWSESEVGRTFSMTSWSERDIPLEPRSTTDKVQPRITTQTLAVAHDSDLGHDGNQLQQVGESCASAYAMVAAFNIPLGRPGALGRQRHRSTPQCRQEILHSRQTSPDPPRARPPPPPNKDPQVRAHHQRWPHRTRRPPAHSAEVTQGQASRGKWPE